LVSEAKQIRKLGKLGQLEGLVGTSINQTLTV